MARFFGRYEHSLDAKGRIILPARFRAHFGTQLYVSQHLERCLALWTPEGFELKLAEMEEAAERGRDERNVARVWSSGSAELELDRQGRIAIPAHLREYARLDTAVLVIGVMNRVELWSPTEFATTVQPSVSYLTGGSDLLAATSVASTQPTP